MNLRSLEGAGLPQEPCWPIIFNSQGLVLENVKGEHWIFNYYYYTLLLRGTGQCVDLVEDCLDPTLMSQALKDPCHLVTL